MHLTSKPYTLKPVQVLSKFPKLRHLDISYSVAPGSLSDVAGVVADLPELQQLHLRGLGLSGPFSCDLLNTARCVGLFQQQHDDVVQGAARSWWC